MTATISTDIIHICEKVLDANLKSGLPSMVSELTQELCPLYESHILTSEAMIPFGRYLLHQDEKKRFHIEAHIFSHNYTGSIHCHETWGLFWLISGGLFVEDFSYDGGNARLLRSGLVRKGGASGFHPPESDWHRVRTFGEDEQTVSLHIYGAGYDQDRGKYLDENEKMIEGNRGTFKENSLFLPFLDFSEVV